MPTLRILHLSDLHLSGIYRSHYAILDRAINLLGLSFPVNDLDASEAITQILYRWQYDIDAVLISGDIAVTGLESDLYQAREFFVSPPNTDIPWLNYQGEPTLQSFGNKPIIIVPGNHDRFRNLFGLPGNLFYTYFSSYWTVGIGGVQSYFLPNREEPLLAIICADFSLSSVFDGTVPPLSHFGQGKVYEERLKNLINETKSVARSHPSCAITWMVHFAPDYENHYPLSEFMRFLESDKLLEQAEELGISYIFCGHTHRNVFYFTGYNDRKIRIHCAGTSTCTNDRDDTTIHLRYIDIENSKVTRVRSHDLLWDPINKNFLG